MMSTEVEDLLSELENLKQEKYSLTLKLEAKSLIVISQEKEVEDLRNELDKEQEKFLAYQKQKNKEDKRNQTILDEKNEFKKLYEDVKFECETLQEKANLLQMQIQAENKKNSEEADELKLNLEVAKEKEHNLLLAVKELELDIRNRDIKIKGYIAEIKQGKKDLEQFQYEIQQVRSSHIYKNHGTSIYSELNEKNIDSEEHTVLQDYEMLKKNYDHTKADLDCTKIQLNILQKILSSNLKDLEEIVDCSSIEILSIRSDVKKMQQDVCRKCAKYKRLRAMLKENQKTEKQLIIECKHNIAKLMETQKELDDFKKGIRNVLFRSEKDVQNIKNDSEESLDGVKHPSTSEKELRRGNADPDGSEVQSPEHNEVEKFSLSDFFAYICLLPHSCCGL